MGLAGLSRWPMWRRWFGTRAERAAEKFLRRRGYKTLARNARLDCGELDLVVLDGEVIVFVEVRSTEGTDLTRPAASVDASKQNKLTQLAHIWLQRHRLAGRVARFDVVAVSWPVGQREPQIEYFPDAFPATGKFQMFT